MSRGQPRLRSRIARRILKRYHNKGEDAIIIEDDTENADVVLIDNPTCSNLGQKDESTTKQNCSPGHVIYIDDEEESSSFSGNPASNQFTEKFNCSSICEDSDSDDDCVMFVRNGKVRCDHSGPSRNLDGLDLDAESSTTESTYLKSNTFECDELESSSSDCEIMDDYSGSIREQWEKAAFKKESVPYTSYQAAASSTTVYPEPPSPEPILQNANFGNHFESSQSDHFEEVLSEFDLTSLNYGEPSGNIHATDENIDFNLRSRVNVPSTQSCRSSHALYEELGNKGADVDSNLQGYSKKEHSMDDSQNLNNGAQEPVKDSSFTFQNQGKVHLSEKEKPSTKKSCDSPTWYRKQVSKAKVVFQERMEQNVDNLSYNTLSNDEIVAEQEGIGFKEREDGNCDVPSPSSGQLYEEPLIHAQVTTDCGNFDGIINNKVELNEISDVGPTFYNESDMLHSYENFICYRERHKKTDQYQRVVEEEWASRHQQLQIQAEEAQKMRRKRKAERIRILDMEKRQKQRLDEIRDQLKKDEETTQLKERIRAEVRKDLEKIEMNCTDMVSVLRALGIHVSGGLISMVDEINAAYKRALLRFHPDRAPRTDVRKQVEAEEKFKLISRLREKLL